MESTDKLFLLHWRSCLFLGDRFVSGKWFYCWCLVLHSTETFDLATWPGLKAKSLSAGCEIVLLTSSSFKTHVHLLHVVVVNQALRLCSFSSFPSVIIFCCVAYITSPWGNVHVYKITEIKSWLLNYFNKYKTVNFAQFMFLTFFQFGLKPSTVSPKETDFTHIC